MVEPNEPYELIADVHAISSVGAAEHHAAGVPPPPPGGGVGDGGGGYPEPPEDPGGGNGDGGGDGDGGGGGFAASKAMTHVVVSPQAVEIAVVASAQSSKSVASGTSTFVQ